MVRKTKALGAAVMAVLAIGAIGAQVAIATEHEHEFHSEAPATDLTGSSSNLIWKLGGFEVKCANTTLSGTSLGEITDHTRLHPTFNNTENTCSTSLGNFSVHTEGCDYTFDSDTDANAHAAIAIICEAGKTITATGPGCTLHLGSQNPTGGVSYINIGAGSTRDLNLKFTVTGLTYTGTHSFGCTIAGLTGHLTGGSTTGDVTVKGYTDSSAHATTDHVGIRVD